MASMWWFKELSVETNVKSITLAKYRLYSVDCALQSYAKKHSGIYPQALDLDFEKTLQEEIKTVAARSGIASFGLTLPKTILVTGRDEAIASAKKILGPQEIAYCPVVDKDGTEKYFVLGKDNQNDLIKVRNVTLIFEPPSK